MGYADDSRVTLLFVLDLKIQDSPFHFLTIQIPWDIGIHRISSPIPSLQIYVPSQSKTWPFSYPRQKCT